MVIDTSHTYYYLLVTRSHTSRRHTLRASRSRHIDCRSQCCNCSHSLRVGDDCEMFVVRRRVRAVCVVILLTVLAALHLHQSADKKADDVGLVSRQKLPSDNGTVYMRGFKGGTGNQIFIFASLYGIARRNKRKPVMLRGCRLSINFSRSLLRVPIRSYMPTKILN